MEEPFFKRICRFHNCVEETGMGRKNTIKKIFIILVVVWAMWALKSTVELQMMSEEKRSELANEGKLTSKIKKSIRMGLDLQGGMYLVYEVDLPKLVELKAQDNNTKDAQLEAILKKTNEDLIDQDESEKDFLTLMQRNFPEGVRLNKYWGEEDDSDDKVLEYLRKEAKDAIDLSIQKLRNRIDRFGVSEPNIQKLQDQRILIELPGASDRKQAKELIGKTALLEFKLLNFQGFAGTVGRIDSVLSLQKIETESGEQGGVRDDTTQGVSQGSPEEKKEISGEVEVAGTDSSVTTGTDSEEVAGGPFSSLLVNLSGIEENNGLRHGHMVSASVDNKKRIDDILARDDIQKVFHRNAEFLWSSEIFKIGNEEFRDLYFVEKETRPVITGKYLRETNVAIGQDVESAGRPEVHFTLNREGARRFGELTGDHIGEQLAIVLDNNVVSAPTIQGKLGARSRITGIPNMDEAKMVEIVLKVGRLDAPIRIEEERTVGPSLGRDSIRRGKYSILIGMVLIILFMIIYYRMAGFIANVALIMNIVVLLAVLAQLGLTLTLPGVAGIVLTIGMAVDANVLVFERIREELRTGKTVRAAVDAGYSRAFRTIMDANITTLLTALVLYKFGTGPVRGFAVTLSIGVVVSMFTALIVTRVIFDTITSRRTLTKLSI
jgi:preprotein translocase subunit SecD